MPEVCILGSKANTFGLAKDMEAIQAALGGAGYSLTLRDPLEPPVACDIAIHLEQPVYVWMPWATRNVLVVNPEWFQAEAWASYMPRFDRVIFKCKAAADAAVAAGQVTSAQTCVVPWGCPPPPTPPKGKRPPQGTADTGFVWFLGGSSNKRAAVVPIVRAWKESFPPLRIYTTAPLDLSGLTLPETVRIEVRDLDAETRLNLGRFFRGHVACSAAEGFGYTAAEAEWLGAYTLLNDIPVYRESYGGGVIDCSGVYMLPSLEDVESVLDAAMERFTATDFAALATQRATAARLRWDSFRADFKGVCDELRKDLPRRRRLPPPLEPADCPPISVVTLLYNRRAFFDLACHSLMIQDYPKDKIEWIIVEDSDDPTQDASDRVMAVAERAAPVRVVYVPLRKKTTIGRKRNIGCEKATADIVLMMDDDDHYPETSFRRRVAWLTKGPWEVDAVAATTIACYDLVRGISAVNMPPMELPLAQRISEATLTFRKEWWAAGGGFPPDIQIGEGEGLLVGAERAGRLLELPPQQIIVAFSHGKNVSSRRVPSGADVKPGCFWGFPREFLEFIHRLAGVTVVEEGRQVRRGS